MKVGSGGNLGLSSEYPKKLFGPMFNSWWSCPSIYAHFSEGVCTRCDSSVFEDAKHVMLQCDAQSTIRNKLFEDV